MLNPLEALRKLEALPEFSGSPAFTQLAVTFKRVKNIATRVEVGTLRSRSTSLASILREPAEVKLLQLLNERIPKVRQAAARRDYKSALNEMASLGPAVDRFFVDVLVMADDAELRRARLSADGAPARHGVEHCRHLRNRLGRSANPAEAGSHDYDESTH